MAQTAVEWLASELHGHLGPSNGPELLAILNQAKAMEKEQMSEVYTEGFKRKAYISELMEPVPEWNEKVPEDFETYYENTYGE
jgi:hypothetical protein